MCHIAVDVAEQRMSGVGSRPPHQKATFGFSHPSVGAIAILLTLNPLSGTVRNRLIFKTNGVGKHRLGWGETALEGLGLLAFRVRICR